MENSGLKLAPAYQMFLGILPSKFNCYFCSINNYLINFISSHFYFSLNYYYDDSIIGAIVVVLGLYLVVWGKSKEYKARNDMQPSPTKDNTLHDQQQLPVTAPTNENSDNKAKLVIHGKENCQGCDQN
jgi:hypothetical protein